MCRHPERLVEVGEVRTPVVDVKHTDFSLVPRRRQTILVRRPHPHRIIFIHPALHTNIPVKKSESGGINISCMQVYSETNMARVNTSPKKKKKETNKQKNKKKEANRKNHCVKRLQKEKHWAEYQTKDILYVVMKSLIKKRCKWKRNEKQNISS